MLHDQEEIDLRWEQVRQAIGRSANPNTRPITLQSASAQTMISVRTILQSEPEVDHITADVIHSRLQAFAVVPDKAASDEIDYILGLFRPFVSPGFLTPCCHWDEDTHAIQVISDRATSFEQEGIYLVPMLCFDHRFTVRASHNQGLMQVITVGSPFQDPQTFNSFLQAFARFSGLR